jgi:hypothetical protein
MTTPPRISFAAALTVLALGCGRYEDSYTETRVVRTTTTATATGSESPILRPPPSRRPIQRVVAVNQPRTARGQREYRVVTAPSPESAAVVAPAAPPPPAPWTGEATVEADPATPPAPAPAPPPPVVHVE